MRFADHGREAIAAGEMPFSEKRRRISSGAEPAGDGIGTARQRVPVIGDTVGRRETTCEQERAGKAFPIGQLNLPTVNVSPVDFLRASKVTKACSGLTVCSQCRRPSPLPSEGKVPGG